MPDDDLTFTDRQARAVVLAAEAVGFEREPELYEAWYDLDLHDDARRAAKHLRARDPAALEAAMVADEPIPADVAARRILDSGRFTCQDAEDVIELASDRGFSPPTSDLPLLPSMDRWDQARAAVEFLWAQHPLLLTERLEERARIAPLPETALRPGDRPLVYDCDEDDW